MLFICQLYNLIFCCSVLLLLTTWWPSDSGGKRRPIVSNFDNIFFQMTGNPRCLHIITPKMLMKYKIIFHLFSLLLKCWIFGLTADIVVFTLARRQFWVKKNNSPPKKGRKYPITITKAATIQPYYIEVNIHSTLCMYRLLLAVGWLYRIFSICRSILNKRNTEKT